ncbi:oxygenase MpaB family protein [Cryobacterium sp. MLB-32]|uniref:oxygenase MpaB family protein n=1 Tax=Cryobacterium sp. MLB-32 TaxID=1529318 RepID=UPI000566EF6A|nr:oxygenase MpaB family protein [Cryobacterium sp. MLB-32]
MTVNDIAGNAVLIAAGGRSILLQLANPAIGHGVANHSDFANRPQDRLNNTLSFVYAIVFGTPEEAAAATRRVNHAHVPVHSAGTDTAPAYSAFTPELQLWVAATLYDSALLMHELVYGPLNDDLADAFYDEYRKLGAALQVPVALWPPDRESFRIYWNDCLADLTTDEATRAVAYELLHTRNAPFWMRAGLPVGRLMTAGLLPAHVREMFDLPWSPARQVRFDRVLRLTRMMYPLLPVGIRHWPKNFYLRALRKSMQTMTAPVPGRAR